MKSAEANWIDKSNKYFANCGNLDLMFLVNVLCV